MSAKFRDVNLIEIRIKMKSTFAVTLLGTFAHAAFDPSYGEAASEEIPASDLLSNSESWVGPSVTAQRGNVYTAGGGTAWKVTQESNEQELTIFLWTEVTVGGNAIMGADNVGLMTCYTNFDLPIAALTCNQQSHFLNDGNY